MDPKMEQGAERNAAAEEPRPKAGPGQPLDREALFKRRRLYRMAKRGQDVFLSAAALLVLAVPMALLSLVICLDSPGAGPIFLQERVGKDGKRFRLYKFRSMVPHAEARLAEVLEQNEMNGPVFKIRDDPRITRVGRFLRKTGLDELPQLFNVLKGEMSLVGPRPPLPREVEQYTDYELQRLCVTPGLTCWWQVQPRRNDLPFERWMELDLEYIRDQSFLLDWKLMFKTAAAVFRMYGS